jgi:hypothetical protein
LEIRCYAHGDPMNTRHFLARATAVLTLLLCGCASLGFPAMGPVDTSERQAGAVQVQGSIGGGYVPGSIPMGGAAVAADVWLGPRMSLVGEGDFLIQPSYLLTGGRVGVRYRLPKGPALGAGFGFRKEGLAGKNSDHPAWIGDLELARSDRGHWTRRSRALRLSHGRQQRESNTSLMGGWYWIWAMSPKADFSLGALAGASLWLDRSPSSASEDMDSSSKVDKAGIAYFGVQIGVAFTHPGKVRHLTNREPTRPE